MANIKSQKKRIKTNEKRRQRNQAVKARVRTFVKKANEAVQSGAENAADTVREAVTEIDRATRKGVLHANSAARKKSTLMRGLGSESER